MIKVSNLSKKYNEVEALKGINLSVAKGELFGLIGPDGAGKTTLIRILTTLLLADHGTVELSGFDVVKHFKDIRKMVGYMPGRFSLYQDLSVEENLQFFATVFNTTIDENYDLIADIYKQIEPFKTRLAGRLSGGMKQKLALSCALIHKPEILILDEPTTGVDAVSRMEFWQMLKRLQTKGITIVVSTPYMDEAGLCDRIALIQNGEILEVDTPNAIIDGFTHSLFAVDAVNKYKLLNDLRAYHQVRSVFAFGDSVHFTAHQSDWENTENLKEYLGQNGNSEVNIRRIKPNIEDCFMDLMVRQEQK